MYKNKWNAQEMGELICLCYLQEDEMEQGTNDENNKRSAWKIWSLPHASEITPLTVP